ncbi:PREDICTED: putative uncharacterized protein C3orf55 homolog [Acanthisitta chloris]|uniref:putative uncharacterized protein C3orf55 homolog n=1 Tax=Acanthisitta chloris TaxID=57068 RepID=UPI0004F0E155|nr:PREDICTED: putative uncharacterized protein C3orf55 homolog [Acanthisitta chloris]
MSPQLHTHAGTSSPVEKRGLCRSGTPWIWPLLQALSWGFLLAWLVGDLITSFLGCYLANQLPIQVISHYSYFFIHPLQTHSLDMIGMSAFICGSVSCVFHLGRRFPQL